MSTRFKSKDIYKGKWSTLLKLLYKQHNAKLIQRGLLKILTNSKTVEKSLLMLLFIIVLPCTILKKNIENFVLIVIIK